MSKYLRKFETEAEYSAATIYKPSVSLISDEMTVIFDPKPHDYSEDYLTFVAIEDGTFSFNGNGAISANTLEYSVDSGSTWSTLQNGGTTPTVTSGNTILWKASGLTIDANNGIGTFSSTGNFEVEGNIMSLLYGDNFVNQTDLTGYNSAFNGLFGSCIKITSAENLILPATTLAKMCYASMFYNCTSLTTAPELPATTLAGRCYYNMFNGCISLTTAPVLSATTLADNCYYGMFRGCISLTTAPVLSATTLASGCCQNMFSGCTSLTTAPILPAETIKSQSYRGMFNGCTSLSAITCLATDISATRCTYQWMTGVAANGTFTKAASMSSWTEGNNGIPSGWTVQDYTG